MGIQRIQLNHILPNTGAHKRHAKRATCGSAGFYTAPQASTSHNAVEPLQITWDVGCFDPAPSSGKLDIYLYAPGLNSSNPRIFRWENVPFSPGSYSAPLNPKWWDASNTTSSTVNLQLKAVGHGDTDLWMSTLPAAPVFKATYDPKTPIPDSVAATANDNHLDLDFKPEPESSKKGKIAAGVLIPLLFIAVGVLAYMKWQRKKVQERRKSFAQHVDKRMSTISGDWKSMSAAGAQAAIRASMAGDPRASMAIRPMSSASSFGAGNQAGFGAGGGYSQHQHQHQQPEMAQMQRTVGVGLRSSAYSNVQAAERVSRISFAESSHPRPRPSGESRRSAYERRSVAGQSRAFHQGYVPPLPTHGHSGSISTSHLNVSTTTLSHYPDEEEEDAMSPKQKQGAFSLSTEDIRLRVGGMEGDQDVGPALSMMRSQANDSSLTVNLNEEEAQYANMPTLPTPAYAPHTPGFSDDPTLFSASPITPSFPNANPFTPTSGTMAGLPYTPMSPDDMLRAYAERQKQQGQGQGQAAGIERVMSPPVGRPLVGGAMNPSRGAYGVDSV